MGKTIRRDKTEVRKARQSLRKARRMLEAAEWADEVRQYNLEVWSSDKYEVQG